jgi:hypothetical protein
LQDKPKSESILKRLRSQTSREIGERFMTTTKIEVWTLLDKESQLYIAEDNKDADESMDSIKTEGADYMHSYMKQGLGGS